MKVSPLEIKKAERILADQDPIMSDLIAMHGPCTVKFSERDPYDTLIRSVIGQQLSTKAAATIIGRVVAATGGNEVFEPKRLLLLTHEELRACGLSNAKARYTADISERALSGQLDFNELENLKNEDAIARLTEIKGVGRWTSEMFLMFAMGRLDMISTGDVGLQRGLQVAYGLVEKPSPAQFEEIAENWRPYRTIACWYLWKATE